jgi:hypothetical protein
MPFIDDNFNGIAAAPLGLPISLGDTRDYNYTVGTPERLTFVAGSTQAAELGVGDGECFGAHIGQPQVLHQMVQTRIKFGDVYAGVAFAGVFCRYKDLQNFVALRWDFNLQRLELMQRVEGVDVSLEVPDLVAAGDVGIGIRLECIGNRARYWFNPRYYLPEDEPPDRAKTLFDTPFEAGDAGEWGVYMNSNMVGATFRVCHFGARELPSTCMPPPDFTFAGASGFNFVPVRATVGNVPADTLGFDWQVSPDHYDDFAEPYVDQTVASVAQRVFWVRPGYRYRLRVRPINTRGVRGQWSKEFVITASGVKVPPSSPSLPNDEFPDVAPDYVLPRRQSAAIQATVSDTTRERLSSPDARPRNAWTFAFAKRETAEVQQIIDFFDRMEGRLKPWKWVHPLTGQQYAVRFDVDELQHTEVDRNSDGGVYDLEFPVVEAAFGVVNPIPITLELDASIFA